MNRTYRRQQTAGKARQTAFLIATVFYALLTVRPPERPARRLFSSPLCSMPC